MNYKETVSKFRLFIEANGFKTSVDRERYIFGGDKNKSYPPVCIKLPLFDYEDIKKTDFFENQINHDLSICKTMDDSTKKNIVLITILLKDLYTENNCPESEFLIILNKIKNLKQIFLLN